MSGFAGVVNLDRSPVNDRLLHRLRAALTFRGPDRQRSQRIGEHVGFVHTLCENTDPSAGIEQPFTFDSRLWIVAHARIDGRGDLVDAISVRHPPPAPDASDVELILRAYMAWGEDCVAHLLGDFAFALWDDPQQRLFCARDHLGVRPFFYAQRGPTVVFSNTLDCVRRHPVVSGELNGGAIADFLLFGESQEPAATSFRDIHRLPPAHGITWSRSFTRQRRYWTLPVDEPVYFKRSEDYSDRFTALLRTAVRDRLRTDRVGILMSGGVDSPTLAATATSLLRERPSPFVVRAFTSVYDRLIPDAERYYAGQVADHLAIPITFDPRDDETSILDWERMSVQTPEPVENPAAFLASLEFLTKAATDVHVFFYGEGPDNALRYEWRPYLRYLAGQGRIARVIHSVLHDLTVHRRVPFAGSIRQAATARCDGAPWRAPYPRWLNEEFATEFRCDERWQSREQSPASPHPVRPAGHRDLTAANWQTLFDDCDITGAMSRAEFRHPFLDVRLLRYMLAVPAMPWCRNKLLIRRSMQSRLPRQVLRRKKSTLPTSPDLVRARTSGFPRLVPTPDLLRYVQPDKVPSAPTTPAEFRSALRPLGLNYWLGHREATDTGGHS